MKNSNVRNLALSLLFFGIGTSLFASKTCRCGSMATGSTMDYDIGEYIPGVPCCESQAIGYGFVTTWEPSGKGNYEEISVTMLSSAEIQEMCCNEPIYAYNFN